MNRFFKSFKASEDGAVTVDWVVLTALIIGLATLLYFMIQTGTIGLSGNVNSALSGSTVSTGTSAAGGGGFTAAGTAGGGGGSGG
ncbi:hypothetical protein [Ruegeria sp. EL01]|jgi:Flp pilus assembly pilin Flp|uniref:hypothetical protein n=1 Tax=Ruegeria sp. EL01 TaxID=2107578 RepID=UPI000EA8061D|nr:hypothetical protein [Ruegeria sp. EL01]